MSCNASSIFILNYLRPKESVASTAVYDGAERDGEARNWNNTPTVAAFAT